MRKSRSEVNLTLEWIMFRKCFAAFLALTIAVGSVFSAEVTGLFVKFADGKLTLKVEDKEKEFTVPADLKIKRKGKDGNEMEIEVTKMLSKVKADTKLTITEDGGKVSDVKMSRGKKKDN
jgi:Skp family chaperone for outer membrane proteins